MFSRRNKMLGLAREENSGRRRPCNGANKVYGLQWSQARFEDVNIQE